MKTQFKWEEGAKVSADVLRMILPHCARATVAGSLRRLRATVGDVEILYIPKIVSDGAYSADLFGGSATKNAMTAALDELLERGVLEKRLNVKGQATWGPSNKLAVHVESGMPVDFFATDEECWFNSLVCRTGGAEMNKEIATAAQRRGWQWNPTGVGFTKRGTGNAERGMAEDGAIHRVGSEKEVFAFVGLSYLHPEERR